MFAEHLGHVKTLARIQSQFHWPEIVKDVKNYVKSCHIYQKMSERGSVRCAPVNEAVLCQRPLQYRYCGRNRPGFWEGTSLHSLSNWRMLTLGWVYTLKYITSLDVANALMSVFCRMGFPDFILSDNGVQLVSRTMRGFTDLLSIAQTFCSRYHAMSHEIVEKFHRCLKQMLANVTAEFPTNWNLVLPALTFVYNEAPHTSAGLSSHQIIFGSSIRGPLSYLKIYGSNQKWHSIRHTIPIW